MNPSIDFRPAIVAPSFNNAQTLPDILSRLDAVDLPIFVVDDGSTDATPGALERWSRDGRRRHLIRHDANRGKAAALRSGFRAARNAGYSHAITIDTDGQLAPEDLPKLAAMAESMPHALVLGARDEWTAGYPARSRVGRRVSNLLVRLECGSRVIDSQCGLRVYPLPVALGVPCRAGHFGFETEIIVRAAWQGTTVVSAPVSCLYFSPQQRVSHFRPWRDSFRAVAMHFRLIADSLARRLARRESGSHVSGPLVPISGTAE